MSENSLIKMQPPEDDNKNFVWKWWGFLNSQQSFPTIAAFLLLMELILNPVIIAKVPYTEIDWEAYMDEVKGFLGGDFNYTNLKGATGPLVYPAGFVYLYSILYYITDFGVNILRAQEIFYLLYIVFIATVFFVYYRAGNIPPWVLIFVCLSRRIHSIFVLRLFNDCFAMLFLYIALACFQKQRWSWGCFWYSVAVSVKMNIFLFAPALLLLLLKNFGIFGTIPKLAICAVVQLVFGFPFLYYYPREYIAGAFNFGRKFFYIWTVNWKFVPEDIFLSDIFAQVLLLLHLGCLLAFVWHRWCAQEEGVVEAITNPGKFRLSPDHIVTLMFTSNFIGFVFSRSLHFQFYVWIYHQLPYLLWQTKFPTTLRIALLVAIEVVWNIFPSNAYGSFTLFICHLTILYGLWQAPLLHTNLLIKDSKLEKED